MADDKVIVWISRFNKSFKIRIHFIWTYVSLLHPPSCQEPQIKTYSLNSHILEHLKKQSSVEEMQFCFPTILIKSDLDNVIPLNTIFMYKILDSRSPLK